MQNSMGQFEFRGMHRVHERAEKAEKRVKELEEICMAQGKKIAELQAKLGMRDKFESECG